MRPETLFASPPGDVAALEDCLWYHTMDIPGVGTISGGWDLRGQFGPYIGNVALRDRSVLDIGAASGFLSFSAEQAGASEVVSFDIDIGERQALLPFKDSLYYRDHAAWAKERTANFARWKNAYWYAHRAFKSKARVIYGDIYHLPPALGTFDVVIMCAVLEHMADPVSAIASVARHAADYLVLGVYIPTLTEEPIAWFLGDPDRPDGDAVFWAYSINVYRKILAMLGFSIETTLTQEFLLSDGRRSPRTAVVARRQSMSIVSEIAPGWRARFMTGFVERMVTSWQFPRRDDAGSRGGTEGILGDGGEVDRGGSGGAGPNGGQPQDRSGAT